MNHSPLQKTQIAIVGAGIVGLAQARSFARRGYEVSVFERSQTAVGASIRNFGMIWPIGQPAGPRLEMALQSREIWKAVAAEAGFFCSQEGSLHLAYHEDEWQILQEFWEANHDGKGYEIELLTPQATLQKSPAVKSKGLKGALLSHTEMIVDPREALAKIPSYLQEKYGVRFQFGQAVTHIEGLRFWAGGKPWEAEQMVVCSGVDFETLFPEKFAEKPITKCKLQMMRTLPQPDGWRLGPSLCAGLTLLHYEAFADCPTLPLLRQRIAAQMSQYLQWGIHVLVSQNGLGEIILGDTHEYGLHLDPFDKEYLNQWVLDYLESFACFPQPFIAERWHGVYAKWPGQSAWVETVAPGIRLVNALGGAGMTLSFGLAESQPEKKELSQHPPID